MGNKIIEIEKGDVISVFSYGYDRVYLADKIIDDLNSNKVLMFNSGSNARMYFPCKRIEMSYGWGLKEMVTEYKKDFSIGIINCLTTEFNTKETTDFIKFLKEDKDMKNKAFVLIFKASFDSFEKGNRLDYKYFNVYKNSIFNNCNKHYSFYRKSDDCSCREWIFEDLLTKTKKYYKQKDWKTCDLILVKE